MISKINNNLRVINIDEIMEMIPHRHPFLLIDRVKDIVSGESAIGMKNVTNKEPFFEGHFPNNPIVPGVLIIEAMAQTSAVLVAETMGSEKNLIKNFQKPIRQ